MKLSEQIKVYAAGRRYLPENFKHLGGPRTNVDVMFDDWIERALHLEKGLHDLLRHVGCATLDDFYCLKKGDK